jgi:hypothetical protein
MKVSVIQSAISFLRIPKVKWVIFQDETHGLYCPHKYEILLDAILNHNVTLFSTLWHESLHHIFNYLPARLYDLLSFYLDITDGNAPELLYETQPPTVVLYTFA